MTTPLAHALLARITDPKPATDTHKLDGFLQAAIERAQAAWPRVAIEPAAFLSFLADRVTSTRDPLDVLGELNTNDLYLACGCTLDDPHAFRAFDAQILAHVPAAVRRFDGSTTFVEEVLQLTRLRLLVAEPGQHKRISTYQGRGKLKSWVQVAAVRIALEMKRRHAPSDVGDEALLDTPDLGEDPELDHIRVMYRKEVSDAFKEALAELNPRERNILRMYLLDGLNIDAIGTVYRVHRATIARWIAHSREQLLDGTRRRVTAKLHLTAPQFESLIHVVRSQIELSLERFLEERKS